MVSCRRMIIFSAILFFFILDQSIKVIMESYLTLHSPKHIFHFFTLYLTHNTGISFSMLSNVSPTILVSIRILIPFIFFIWKKNPKTKSIFDIGYILITTGALGNVVDHCLYGYVIDYIMIHTQTWSFAVFNLADLFISIGTCIIIYDDIILQHRQKGKIDFPQ